MKIELEISDDIIRNAIGGAAVSYWCDVGRWNRDAIVLVFKEHDAGSKPITLMRGDFQRGLVALAAKYPHHFKDLIAETGDACTGDILIQCAAFGEERYC